MTAGGRPRKRRRREVETTDYLKFCRRILRAAGRRVAEGDPIDLADLVEVRRELDEVIGTAVVGMRERYGYSWTEIGRELGVTRQSAQQTYGRRAAAARAKIPA